MIRALLLALGAGAVAAACRSSEAGESSCAAIYEWGGATWGMRQVEVTLARRAHVAPLDADGA